jgi:hypothetical protein
VPICVQNRDQTAVLVQQDKMTENWSSSLSVDLEQTLLVSLLLK